MRSPTSRSSQGALLATLLLLSGAAGAQNDLCDPLLPTPQDDEYAYRLRGDRCEGRYIKEVGGSTLLIASFATGIDPLDRTRTAGRQISWPHFPGAAEVRIRVQSLKRRLYYRMDTRKPADAGAYTWPSDVVAAVAPGRDDIGVMASTQLRVGTVERSILLPVWVTYEGATRHAQRYQLVVVPGVQLAELAMTVSELANDGGVKRIIRKEEPLQYDYYPAERGIATSLPTDTLGPAGLYRVELLARLESGGAATAEMWFFHPGP